MNYQLLQGDNRTVLRTLPDQSVHCIVTSPPYYGLRDYGTAQWDGGDPACDHKTRDVETATLSSTLGGGKKTTGHQQEGYRDTCGKCGATRIDQQIGLESTPEQYVAELVTVFRECWRVLRDDGSLWLNLGDSYAARLRQSGDEHAGRLSKSSRGVITNGTRPLQSGFKEKDLIGIPWLVAFALRADGWYLRSDIIWAKPNPMPESVTDRPTKAHEYIFLLTKSQRYYYDAEAVKEDASGKAAGNRSYKYTSDDPLFRTKQGITSVADVEWHQRNRRSVWTVATAPYSGAHFATFPPALIEPCILAGTSEHGCCAQCGAPWERVVERTDQPDLSAKGSYFDKGKTGVNGGGRVQHGERYVKQATGWQATCTCNLEGINYAADDMEIIETPTGERVADDPTMQTGRGGLNRPRGKDEGHRPITRYEQRQYAMQLRNSNYREHMEHEAGSAFAHYIRTDASGARPVPGDMLDSWITRGWIERVAIPTFTSYPVIPCTVCDPFNGSGTTGAVACAHNRNYIGIDLSADYIALAHERIREAINESGRAYIAPVCKVADFVDLPLFGG